MTFSANARLTAILLAGVAIAAPAFAQTPAPVTPPVIAAPPAPADGSTRPVPLGNVATWVALEDIPPAGNAPGNAHAVRVRLSVSPLGFVDGCSIVTTSNDATVDAAICATLQRNAFFTPAKNAAGQAIAGEYIRNVRWAAPDPAAAPAAPPAPAQ